MAYPATIRSRVLREIKKGASLNSISKKFKIATQTLAKWRNEADLTRAVGSPKRVGRKVLLRKPRRTNKATAPMSLSDAERELALRMFETGKKVMLDRLESVSFRF